MATIDVGGQPSAELLETLRGVPHVLSVSEVTLRRGDRGLVSRIRPFRARVVRPEWARRLVTGLAELPEDTGTLPPVAPPDPAAYDESEAALYVYRQGDHTGVVCEVDVRRLRRRAGARARGGAGPAGREPGQAHETTDAPPALVALLHHAGPAYARGFWTRLTASPPLLDFAGPGGLEQRVWRVPAGGVTDGPRRRAGRRRPLHRRRSPPGRGRARGLAAARRARRLERPVRRAPDGRAAALGVPPAGARPGRPRAELVGRCSSRASRSSRATRHPPRRPARSGCTPSGRWYDVTPRAPATASTSRCSQAQVLDRLAQAHRDRARARPPSTS